MQRLLFCIILASHLLAVLPAAAEERFALVIGNGAYQHIDPLANPPNDVRLVAEQLEAVGFHVTLLINASMQQMDRATVEFSRTLDDAGRNTVGLFYFAGHGVTYDGENWLIPVGANIESGIDIKYNTLSAGEVLGHMEAARNATDILILDACRNSPFRSFSLSGTRAVSRGMARMDAPAGSFIAYSTAPGAVAYDGSGDYSPFAEAFAHEIATPGISIGDTMIEVRKRVKENTKGLGPAPQTPWDASSLTGRFVFNPGEVQYQPEPPPANVNLPSADERFWENVKESQNPAEFEAYLNRFPEGEFADIARLRRDSLTTARTGAAGPQASRMDELATSADTGGFAIAYEGFVGIVTRPTGMHEGPDESSREFRRLDKGDVVKVTGRVEGKLWYRVELDGGVVAYASATAINRL
jgi:hypothetical protein